MAKTIVKSFADLKGLVKTTPTTGDKTRNQVGKQGVYGAYAPTIPPLYNKATHEAQMADCQKAATKLAEHFKPE